METLFAPAERLGVEEARKASRELAADGALGLVLDLVPDLAFVLDARRQVLYANEAALSSFGLEGRELLGARMGEIVSCVHSGEMPGGCGTSEACRHCGAVGVVMEALATGARASRESRILTSRGGRVGSLDLLVTASPIGSESGRLLVVTMVDIGDSKRRQVLERLFLHDIMNSVSNLQACVILIEEEFGSLVSEHDYFGRLSGTVRLLADEVCQQRDFIAMEKGELKPDLAAVDLSDLVRELARSAEAADYARGKRLALRAAGPGPIVSTDRALVGRVVLNMLKNAFEASTKGEEVALEVAAEGGRAAISVRNPAFMPREIQLQIFQRSFSTKGRGRGIGTYSMKLLTEEHLGGRVEFSSDEERGTEFRLLLPLAGP
jgi:nitrogen fixation/metabolism regulation signal transduction histidine kinase